MQSAFSAVQIPHISVSAARPSIALPHTARPAVSDVVLDVVVGTAAAESNLDVVCLPPTHTFQRSSFIADRLISGPPKQPTHQPNQDAGLPIVVAMDDDQDDDDGDDQDDGDDIDDAGFGTETEDGGFKDGLDDDEDLDDFDDIDEDDFDDDFDDDFEEELEDDYEIEIDDEISAEFGLNTAGGDDEADEAIDDELDEFEDFESID